MRFLILLAAAFVALPIQAQDGPSASAQPTLSIVHVHPGAKPKKKKAAKAPKKKAAAAKPAAASSKAQIPPPDAPDPKPVLPAPQKWSGLPATPPSPDSL